MERKFLEDMEISKENVDKILNEYHSKIKSKDDKITTLEEEAKGLKSEISTRDKDLKELKKIDAEGLEQKLTDLQKNYDTLKEESESKLKETTRNMLLDNTLGKSKAKDLNDIKKFLDMEKIIVDGEKLIGLDDQLMDLEKNKGYLFNLEEPKQQVDLGGDHKGDPIETHSLLEKAMGITK